ncbi:MAG: Hsp20/alpha crystallin family protein [Candidatus Marinimicrobia bacterium]|nr:Hsp20/alpha crystallin family protein [Candidatus Neomarinimicrobiota bacterium]RKY61693.1 MAG: Hsp20/alpha crystallin family protein [Candidatus Neomarinimicrobiota bacterium]
MSLVKWTPRTTLNLRNEFDRLFDSFFNTEEEETSLAAFSPSVDIMEKEKEFLITAELPGIKKDDIKMNIRDNVLTVSGEKKQEKKTEKDNFHRTERVYGSFQRSFRLPDSADQENISAEFKDGVLSVTIPKLKESISKSIDIKIK